MFTSETLFKRIVPFNSNDEYGILNENIISHHTEIGLCFDGNNILAWDTCHPSQHFNFKYGKTFKNSHLSIESEGDSSVSPWAKKDYYTNLRIKKKIDIKIQLLTDNYFSGKFPIQVIIGGFESFYEQLSAKLSAIPSTEFLLFREHYNTSDDGNIITGILIDKHIYEVINSRIQHVGYYEKGGREDNDLYSSWKNNAYPIILVRNKISNKTYTIIGVCIKECNYGYPKDGIISLQKIMDQERKTNLNDVIAIGNFNSFPCEVQGILENIYDPLCNDFYVKLGNYFTYCGDYLRSIPITTKHDMSIVLTDNPSEYISTGLEEFSKHSISLVKCMNDNQVYIP